jgi:hypothetical protein
MTNTNPNATADPRPFLRHMALAAAWVRYNSRTGKATEKRILAVMGHLTVADLERMLGERNIALPTGVTEQRVR